MNNINVVKPPIGVVPEKIWKSLRLVEITEAIRRYVDAKMYMPAEWDAEVHKLLSEQDTKIERAYLYKSWDESFYFTNVYDGVAGLKIYLCGDTSVEDINRVLGDENSKISKSAYDSLRGLSTDIILYKIG